MPPGFDYVAVLLGIWRAGGIAVPLAIAHPPAERGFVVEDSDAAIVVSSPELASGVEAAGSSGGRCAASLHREQRAI